MSSVVAPDNAAPAAGIRTFRHWPLLVGLFVASVLLAYWPTLAGMAHVWDTSNTYAHGWLIAPISLYFLYRMRPQLAAAPQALCWWALLPLAAAGLAWSLGALADIQVVQQLALVGIVIGTVLFLMGWRWALAASFPLGFLFLAVPLGDGLVPHMIELTADFVVAALRLSGIPVYRDGTFFVIPSGSWSVVSGCSGMRYLMATVTVAVLFAWLNYRSHWRRIIFVAVAIVFAFVANWLRAYGIVMIAHLSGMKLALGIDHYIYGWVFFGVIIFLLMLIGGLFSDRSRDTEPVAGPPAPRERPRALLPALLALAVVVHLWPLATRALVAAAPVSSPTAAALAAASGAPDLPAPDLDWTPHYIGDPARHEGGLAAGDRVAGWQLAWYSLQRQGVELIHAGNRLVDEKYDPWRQRERRDIATGNTEVPVAIETTLRERNGPRSILVWQWYWVAGRVTIDTLEAKLFGVLGQLEGRGNPAASILLYTVMDDDADLDAARAWLEARLPQFAPPLHAALAAQEQR
ncbi:MAG TPA: exosortase A [Gammaproteobacteria bacterium]|nr:exosortase A [Gammaproteobacteria bacterium]